MTLGIRSYHPVWTDFTRRKDQSDIVEASVAHECWLLNASVCVCAVTFDIIAYLLKQIEQSDYIPNQCSVPVTSQTCLF